MKTKRLEKIYAVILLIIFGGIVVHAPLSVSLGTLVPGSALLIKSWKELLLLAATGLALVLVTRRRLWKKVFTDKLLILMLMYVALHILLVPLNFLGTKAAAAGLAIDLRYIVFFMLVYLLFKLTPRYYRLFLMTAAAGAAVVVGFATLQLFLPADILRYIGYGPTTIQPYLTVDKNPDYIRFNSTLRGPNPLGAYTVIVFGILAGALAGGRFKNIRRGPGIALGLLLLCTSVALWISYSRSALVAAVIAVAAAFAVSFKRITSRQALVIGGLIVAAVTAGFLVSRSSSFVSNVVLHENPAGGSAVSSNAAHASSLESGLQRLVRQPFGAGVGSTGSASLFTAQPTIIENHYLMVAHETGWLGLGLFAAIFIFILYRLWLIKTNWLALGVLASGLGLALIGLVLPVWADDTVSLVWWGLAGLALGGTAGQGHLIKLKRGAGHDSARTSHQKTA